MAGAHHGDGVPAFLLPEQGTVFILYRDDQFATVCCITVQEPLPVYLIPCK